MVLDEDALESLIRDQKKQDKASEDRKESKQVELTHETEEFEVYERPGEDDATEQPDEAEPTVVADDDAEILESAPAMEEPESIEEEAEPVVEEDVPERPRVWPPLSSSKVQVPEPAPPPAVEELPTEPEAAPEPMQEVASSTGHPTDHHHAELRPDGDGVRIAIVQALFNQELTDRMAEGAVARANERGADVTHHVTVPGVYDLPLLTARLLERDDVDCAVVLGVVVQGETTHDQIITQATATSLQQVSLDVDKPIGFGVTGPGMTWAQAEARIGNGAHAVDAALAQVAAIKNV